jgi:hypothetical protein
MRHRLGGALVGLSVALAIVGPAAAQQWPAYGGYGYGSGYDYNRNPYSYPRAPFAQGPSVPDDAVALYGGYMPNSYYTGAAYALNRATLFPSGRAYCETAGSYLYCADIESASGYLLSTRGGAESRTPFEPPPSRPGSNSVFAGVLATRTVGDTSFLVGTLRSPDGEDVVVNCTGRLAASTSLSCR